MHKYKHQLPAWELDELLAPPPFSRRNLWARKWARDDVRKIYYSVLALFMLWGCIALGLAQPLTLIIIGANMAGFDLDDLRLASDRREPHAVAAGTARPPLAQNGSLRQHVVLRLFRGAKFSRGGFLVGWVGWVYFEFCESISAKSSS